MWISLVTKTVYWVRGVTSLTRQRGCTQNIRSSLVRQSIPFHSISNTTPMFFNNTRKAKQCTHTHTHTYSLYIYIYIYRIDRKHKTDVRGRRCRSLSFRNLHWCIDAPPSPAALAAATTAALLFAVLRLLRFVNRTRLLDTRGKSATWSQSFSRQRRP